MFRRMNMFRKLFDFLYDQVWPSWTDEYVLEDEYVQKDEYVQRKNMFRMDEWMNG